MHGGRGVGMVRDVHGRGSCMEGGGHLWQGGGRASVAGGVVGGGRLCMAGGHAWQGGMCGLRILLECMHGGECVAGGVCGGGGVCVAGETATIANGTHPIGMHSCLDLNVLKRMNHT